MSLALLTVMAVNGFYLPTIARFFAGHDYVEVGNKFRAMLLGLISIGFVISFGWLSLGNYLLEWILGPGYESLKSLSWLIGLCMFIRFVAAPHGILLTAVGGNRHRVVVNGIALAAFSISVVCLSGIGFHGIMVSACISSTFTLVGTVLYLRRLSLPSILNLKAL